MEALGVIVGAIEEGGLSFILFALMVIVVFVAMVITIAR
jgi:hypothetical protein